MIAPPTFSHPDPMAHRSSAGFPNPPTIVALGPFDDAAHAEQLAAAFTSVRRRCHAQLILLGTGAQRPTVVCRTFAQGVRNGVHVVDHCSNDRWPHLVAAADVVVPSAAAARESLLDALATGRPVVAPINPTTVRLLVLARAGLVYPPGDVRGMARALLRLLTTPKLRHEMGCRASEVARRQQLRQVRLQESGDTVGEHDTDAQPPADNTGHLFWLNRAHEREHTQRIA